MSIDDAIFNGAVSMISALIGGCLALRGTRLAIKHEKEKDREAKEEQARDHPKYCVNLRYGVE